MLYEKILLVSVENKKKIEPLDKQWRDGKVSYEYLMAEVEKNANRQYQAMFVDRQPLTIVNGLVTKKSLIADIEIIKDFGNVRFAKIVKVHTTEPITIEDLVAYDKACVQSHYSVQSIFYCFYGSQEDIFYKWLPLPNAIYGVRYLGARHEKRHAVYYKVEGSIYRITSGMAEGDPRKDKPNKENVGDVAFVVNSEDRISPTSIFTMSENTVLKNTVILSGRWVKKTLHSEPTEELVWSEPEIAEGSKISDTNDKKVEIFVPSLGVYVPNDGTKTHVILPKMEETPNGMEIDELPLKATVQYVKVADTAFKQENYLYKVVVTECSDKATWKKKTVYYSSYGDGDNRRSGIDS